MSNLATMAKGTGQDYLYYDDQSTTLSPKISTTSTAIGKDPQTEVESWIQQMEKNYAGIRKHIKATCNHTKEDDPVMSIIKNINGKINSFFIVDPKHHLAYCRHAKVYV